jgi:hypothetical protein
VNRGAVRARMRLAAAAPPVSAALLALVLAGCGSKQPTDSASGAPNGSGGPSGSGTDASGPLTSLGPPPTAPGDTTPISLDPTLLAILPATIGATPVQEDLDVAGDALRDQALPRIATGVDAAVAVDTATGNLVTAWIVRLRPGTFGDTAYGQWRDSYDDGACNAAGGVVGRAQATLGGRDTYITSCVAALRTYHVWLKDQNVLVSASSIGARRFGEKLMSTLRVPGSPDATVVTSPETSP